MSEIKIRDIVESDIDNGFLSLLEVAKAKNCYKTILDCKHELIPFYERIGFKQESNQMRYNH